MAITTADFFGFGSKYPELLEALFEVDDAVDAAALRAMIDRYVDEDGPSRETIEQQLLDYGILQEAPYAQTAYELRREVRELLAWILNRQMLATAEVIQGYLEELKTLMQELNQGLRNDDFSSLLQPLAELRNSLEKIRSQAEGNLQSITTQVQQLQADREEMTPRERFEVVNRIWKKKLTPLRELIDDRGMMEARFDRLAYMLKSIERNEAAPRGIQRRAANIQARLVRTRRVLAHSHDAAVREVAPLYEQLRADSRLLEGASRLLERLRQNGPGALDIDAELGLVGWRPRGLISDTRLTARVHTLQDYEPRQDATLSEPEPVEVRPPLRKERVGEVLAAACPVDDVLKVVMDSWADRPLNDRLRVFFWVHRGDFGACQIDEEAGEQVYEADGVRLHAWPVKLQRVQR